MSAIVTALYRYPVKGLTAESLSTVLLQRDCAFPHDRQFAIAHCHSQYQPQQPAWVTRRHFAVLAYSPSIACIGASFDAPNRCIKLRIDQQSFELFVDHNDINARLNAALQSLHLDSQPGPYTLAEVPQVALTDSPEPLVSLMNTRSLDDLQQRTGNVIEAARFRGNIWFEGVNAWQERHWPGKVLSVGRLQVEVVEPIVRCGAIDANPLSGERDIALLQKLNGLYGHNHFGVLARVLNSASISIGDLIEEQTSLHTLGI